MGTKLSLDLARQIQTQNRLRVERFYIVPTAAMDWKNRLQVISVMISEYLRNDDGNRTFNSKRLTSFHSKYYRRRQMEFDFGRMLGRTDSEILTPIKTNVM